MTLVTSGKADGGGGVEVDGGEVDGGDVDGAAGFDDGVLHHRLFTSPAPCGTSKLSTSSNWDQGLLLQIVAGFWKVCLRCNPMNIVG